MLNNYFSREISLIGEEKFLKLQNARVAVFGLGGVGSYVVEGLARAGISNFLLVDDDDYSVSNINRQLYATIDTLGRKKVEVSKERILSINPNAKVEILNFFVLDNLGGIDLSLYDYVVDAIDTVTAKLTLIKECKKLGVSIISCMGTGNKLNPSLIKIDDIKNTKVCPLCRVMRKLLKDNGIENLKVAYSEEQPLKPLFAVSEDKNAPSSVVFVPAVAGLTIAHAVFNDIISK